ncbi:MAG: PilZ domain-containing protein [Pseudomonadota bacterium]
MTFPAPLAVSVEIRNLARDQHIQRVWRLSSAIGVDGLSLERNTPFCSGTRVVIELRLPDQQQPVSVVGTIREAECDESTERPAVVEFGELDAEARALIIGYIEERTAVR